MPFGGDTIQPIASVLSEKQGCQSPLFWVGGSMQSPPPAVPAAGRCPSIRRGWSENAATLPAGASSPSRHRRILVRILAEKDFLRVAADVETEPSVHRKSRVGRDATHEVRPGHTLANGAGLTSQPGPPRETLG